MVEKMGAGSDNKSEKGMLDKLLGIKDGVIDYIKWLRYLTPLEAAFASKTRDILALGRPEKMKGETAEQMKARLEWFETYKLQEQTFSDEKVIWLDFPGIGKPPQEFNFDNHGLDPHWMIPRQGKHFIFHGPPAIAGYTPESCDRATNAVLEKCKEIAEKYPDHKIRIFNYSSGTHLGFRVANELNRRTGQVDRMISLAPGESIGYGIYETPVAKPVADYLRTQHVSPKAYTEAIKHHVQANNLEHLPDGFNHWILGGERDNYIPADRPGGTNDLVYLMREKGMRPWYFLGKIDDHITWAGLFGGMQKLGFDPYMLKAGAAPHLEDPHAREEYIDAMFLPRVEQLLEQYDDKTLIEIALYLTQGDDSSIEGFLAEPVGRLLVKAIAARGVGHIELQVGMPVFVPSLNSSKLAETLSSSRSWPDAEYVVRDIKALLQQPASWFNNALSRGTERFDCPRYRARFQGEKDPLERPGV